MSEERTNQQNQAAAIESSLTTQVYRSLKEEILSARLGADPFCESLIADKYGVSKTPVREALRQLVHDGLVVVIPRKGYLVKPMGVTDIVEVMDMRRFVEPALAAEAARNRSDEQVEEMRQLIAREQSTTPSLDGLRVSLELHELIAEVGGNSRATAVVRSLLDESSRIPWLSPSLRIQADAGEHPAIVDAIDRGDAEAAARAMTTHLERAKARTLKGLGAL